MGGGFIRFVKLVSLMISLLLLSGCTATQPAAAIPAVSGEKVTLVFYDTTDSSEAAKAIVQAFNAQSTTTFIEDHYINNDDYDDMLKGWVAEGSTAFDICYVRQPAQVNALAAKGAFADISDYIGSSGLNPANYGPTLDIITPDQGLYALPRTRNIWMLFYNRDIFRQAGLEDPGQLTWDEYAALCSRLTLRDESGSILRYGGFIPLWTPNLGGAVSGEYLYDDELPATQRYISLLHRMYLEDQSIVPVSLMDTPAWGTVNDIFPEGRVATMIMGDWQIYNLHSLGGVQPDWDVAPLPVFENVTPGTTAGPCSYTAISSACAHPANAFEFLRFFCGEEGARIQADHAIASAYYTEESEAVYLRNARVSGAHYFFDAFVLSEQGSYQRYRELTDLFTDLVKPCMLGETTVDDVFTAYNTQRRVILQSE